ncbi:arginyl-tRNA synthetase [Vermiconidia calcicola]|uniref:Arginyl-tRNA synthetase n=1 Tax=Vermiconidia calcicola TaxID=1690605 RepID=A0ACC3NI79_9PEZI|nr:arginyl-tRNA synthetase [Vermiconidia calcicola]
MPLVPATALNSRFTQLAIAAAILIIVGFFLAPSLDVQQHLSVPGFRSRPQPELETKPKPKPKPNHPIDDLIRAANKNTYDLLEQETRTVHDAARAYRQRRGRQPPPGFDVWFSFAQNNSAIVVEEFWDRIYDDLNPFWGVSAKYIRDAANDYLFRVSIRNGTATQRTDDEQRVWLDLWQDLTSTVAQYLPDVDMPINQMDESRMVVEWEGINEYMAKEKQSRRIVPEEELKDSYQSLADLDEHPPEKFEPEYSREGPYWPMAVIGCPPDSPARRAPIETDFTSPPPLTQTWSEGSYKGYVQNWTLAKSPCENAHFQSIHGTFVEPISLANTKKFFPLFGGSKLPMNNEILLPAAMYWTKDPFYSGGEDHGEAWRKKKDAMIWRGAASGGRNSRKNWTRFQRHRFVSMMNATSVNTMETLSDLEPPNFVLPANGSYDLAAQSPSAEEGAMSEWIAEWSDVAVVHLLCFPKENAKTCSYTNPYFSVEQMVPMKDQYDYKYLPDIDGNSFSGRYRGFLMSTSLPIKATIYEEWHDSRLVPWKHFIPMDNTFIDIYGIMEYFLGNERMGVQGHDEVARDIAIGGKQWADKVLRREDMQIYVFRLLLESGISQYRALRTFTSENMALSNGATKGETPNMDHITSELQNLGISAVPQFPGVQLYPLLNPVDVYRAITIDQLQSITGAEPAIINNALQWTQDLKHGDLMLPVPALRLKGKKPDEVAKDIAEKFDSPLLEKPSADKTFVRFFFKAEPYAKLVIPSILKHKDDYGFNSNLGLEDPSNPGSKKLKMIVEYSSPNIAKEFHTGHLRSTIIGGFLVKLYARAGWETFSMNYLGDWGKQYGVLTQGFEKYGSEEELQSDPVKHLNEVYVKINQDNSAEQKPVTELTKKKADLEKLKIPPKPQKPAKGKEAEPMPEHKWTDNQEKQLQEVEADIEKTKQQLAEIPSIDEKARQFFLRMYKGDPDALKNWQRFRDLSIEAYIKMYARLNIHFDEYGGESTVKEADMEQAAQVLQQKGISEDSKGAVIVDLSKHGAPNLGKTLVKKRDGTSLYLTRDIAANFERYEKYHFDRMIYVIASQQDVHVAQFFKILELMGPPYSEIVSKCEHITFGMVKDPKGQTMSTRKGTVVSLADSLDHSKEFMHDVMKKNQDKYEQVVDPEATADILAISAIMVQDYSGKRVNNYNFDMEKMTSFEGDTGPYLQYSHARVCSMERKTAIPQEQLLNADLSLITAKEGIELVRLLAQWPDVFLNTYKTREPVTILTYLFKMTHQLSSCYDAKDVNNRNAKTMTVMYAETPEKKAALMALYASARQVLSNGMKLLGLTPVQRM